MFTLTPEGSFVSVARWACGSFVPSVVVCLASRSCGCVLSHVLVCCLTSVWSSFSVLGLDLIYWTSHSIFRLRGLPCPFTHLLFGRNFKATPGFLPCLPVTKGHPTLLSALPNPYPTATCASAAAHVPLFSFLPIRYWTWHFVSFSPTSVVYIFTRPHAPVNVKHFSYPTTHSRMKTLLTWTALLWR